MRYTAIANNTTIKVYHATDKVFTKFNPKRGAQHIIWFTNNLKGLIDNELGAAGSEYLLTLQVTYTKACGWKEYDQLGLDEIESRGYDCVLLKEPDGTFDGFVFDAKQVKIIKRERMV